MTPFDNLVSCEKCGESHESHTICGSCYEQVRREDLWMEIDKDLQVRVETNAIKEKMMEYNPYKGEVPPKRVEVTIS